MVGNDDKRNKSNIYEMRSMSSKHCHLLGTTKQSVFTKGKCLNEIILFCNKSIAKFIIRGGGGIYAL